MGSLLWLVLATLAGAAPETPVPGDGQGPASDEAPSSSDEPPSGPQPAPTDGASAEPTPAEAPAAPVFPRLPVPLDIRPALHPAAALEAGLEARVLLELDIDALGQVLQANVVEPAGDGFDEAVLAVADGWRFEPALDDKGRPVAARIRYAYQFRLDRAPQVNLRGQVREAGIRVPLRGVTVTALGPDGQAYDVETDAEGEWAFADLAEGVWTVVINGPGLERLETEQTVKAGAIADSTVYVVRDRPWMGDDADETIEVVGRAVAAEVTERTLTADEIRYLPGSNGDVVKAVQNLPGLARPPLGIGQLIVRGTSPEDSAYYVDGINIPLAFHFGGLATVVPSDAIEQVAFLPGNFGVRYGRVIGGAIDIRTTSSLPERSNGYVSVDVFQANVFAEQRVSKRTAVTLSGRRSYADAVLNPILNGMEGVNIRAPRYYDLQARIVHETPSGGRFDSLFLLSDDAFRFLGPPEEGEEEQKAEIGLTQGFRRLRTRFTQPLPGGWRSETAVGLGPSVQTFEFGGDGEAYEKEWAVDLRQEVYRGVPDDGHVGWRFGTDTRTDRVKFLYDIPGFGSSQKEQDQGWRIRPSLYAESTIRLGAFEIVPGLRGEGQFLGDHQTVWVDPRLSSTLQATATTRVKAAIGRYSQAPLARQVLAGGGGSPDLGPTRSLQTSVGVEQQLAPSVSAELTHFNNFLSDVIVGREDAFRFFTGPPPVGPFDIDPWANAGTGRIYGLEASVKGVGPRLVALGSATLSHSQRTDRAGNKQLFAYDQPVVLNALASYKLPKQWRLGGRVRYSSGNPYTPVVNRIFDQGSRSFIPVYGERDSSRLSPFWSLDVRVDKDWTFDRWKLTAYLDVQNATNNQNVEVMGWTYDFREENPTTSIPLLPAFGLRGEW